MLEHIENTLVFQPIGSELRFAYYDANTCSIDWQKTATNNKSIKEIINNKQWEHKSIIVLPKVKVMEACLTDRAVILITKGSKNVLILLYPELTNYFWEVNEENSSMGITSLKLTEPEINKALRFVFNTKPNKIIISLTNSIFNSLHETILRNVLNTAGYKSIVAEINK